MQYAWLNWSLLLLIIWLFIFFSLKSSESKKEMLIVSLWTSLFGLSEPFFVPEYWNPLSLFDLARTTGFDIESLIFSFGVGGIAVVIYEKFIKVNHIKIKDKEKRKARHKYHIPILLSAPLLFLIFWFFTDLNPIYSVIIALFVGGVLTWYCRPDLKAKMLFSAFVFTAIYFVYFLTLIVAYPGYVEAVWNFEAITGIMIIGVPLEELLFAFSLGFLWSSVYEHIGWYKIHKV